nr:SCP extracellular domain containing protein [Haemonchus contortus]
MFQIYLTRVGKATNKWATELGEYSSKHTTKKGKVKTKTLGKLPAAANMRFMEYDCGLEEKAINLTLTSEEFRKRSEFTDAEKNFATIESNENNSPSKAAEQAVSDWWERKSHWRNLKNITDGDYEAFPFFLIAQADTDKVGCAVKYYMYDNKFYYDLACFYGKKVEVGSELYREGPKCTNCTGGYECYHALCKKQKP